MNKVTKKEFESKDEFKILNKLHLECGHSCYFMMALSHLFDKGFEEVASITDEELENMQTEIEQKQKEKKGVPIMTAEFQVSLVKMAREMAKVGMWDVLKYVQNYVDINK